MDVKLSIEEEEVGMTNSIEKEIKKDEGGDSVEMLEDEMDSLKEDDIWRSRRERMNNALVTRQEPKDLYAAASRLVDIIKGADVEEFISLIERLADQTDPSAIFNFQGLSRGSLLHVAAETGKDGILRLLVDYVGDRLIAAQNDWGDTPLHMAAKAGGSRAAAMLIRRARDLPNVDNILRIKNKHGNTALHEAVLHNHVDVVRLLLREDFEPVYWKNMDQKSPFYLALDIKDPKMHKVLFSLRLKPSKIQGLPPIHGAILRGDYELVAKIFKWNMKLFAMTDSEGGNVFHLAASMKQNQVFEFLRPETEYLAREQDMNGDLPIHIASKMGHFNLIEKLHPVSHLLNKQGQTVLHVAAKYGRDSVVRCLLGHPDLGTLINERDHAGNTALHLATMHSQPAAMIPLVLDERIDPLLLNHECLTALKISEDRFHRRGMTREMLAVIVLRSKSARNTDLLVLWPKARDKELAIALWRIYIPKMDVLKDVINARLLVAALVATVTFAAGFTVPGGFDSSDKASKDDRGIAMMLDKRMFQAAFVICNTIAMFCAMIAVISLMYAQHNDIHIAIAGFGYASMLLTVALPAMSAAFLTGVTLTVGKLPWLANTIYYLGLVFFLIISVATLLQYPQLIQSHCRPVLRLKCWLVLGYIYLCGVKTNLLDDTEEDGYMASGTSASRPPDGAGESKTDDSVTAKCGHSPHPPNH